jgi:hypothetical protein
MSQFGTALLHEGKVSEKPKVTTLLRDLLNNTRSWESHKREVLQLTLDTIGVMHEQVTAQEAVIKYQNLKLQHLKTHEDSLTKQLNQWQRIAEDRSAEILRLMDQIDKLKREKY